MTRGGKIELERLRITFRLRANGRNNSQPLLAYNVGSCCVWHMAKSLTGFKLCATTPNTTQQHATGCENGRDVWRLP